ncbi:MAG: carboxypeptidase regulatory-like domain-containing protein [Bacteroidia bacterium]|nr:carboxypeptidase regulatory-like domain-containing protein [Bacteroidia bacterium]
MIKRLLKFVAAFTLLAQVALAQQGAGAIKGQLVDDAKEPIPFANVVAITGGNIVGQGQSDFDGNYVIKPLKAGTYTIKATCVGFTALQMDKVGVSSDETRFLKLTMSKGTDLKEVKIVEFKNPAINQNGGGTNTIDKKAYQNMAAKDLGSVVATGGGVGRSNDRSGELNIRGQRGDAANIMIDGERAIGGKGVPQRGVEQIDVVTSGIPARYGNVTGGVINITTSGATRKLAGGIEAISSQLTDAYKYNFIGGNLTGPILKAKDADGNEFTKIGFSISGEATTQKDPNPSIAGATVIRKDKFDSLKANPVRRVAGSRGVYNEADFLRARDFQFQKARANMRQTNVALNGKLEFAASKNATFTLGGSYNYTDGKNYIFDYSLLANENNSQNVETTWRAYAKTNLKFGQVAKTAEEKDKTAQNVTNINFAFQAGFQRYTNKDQDARLKQNSFDYGYVGKFTPKKGTLIFPDFIKAKDTIGGVAYDRFLSLKFDSITEYEAGGVNTTLDNYTNGVYAAYKDEPSFLRNTSTILALNGLINGTRPNTVAGLWSNVGRSVGGYSIIEQNRFRANGSISADVFTNHAIEIGFEYEQNNNRSYNLTALNLWSQMRQLANKQIGNGESFDFTKTGGKVIDNVNKTTTNEVLYEYTPEAQTNFDKNLREKLGITNDKELISIDAIDRDKLSLDMFSADELLNINGVALVGYNGFDHTGKRTNTKFNIDDFFTEKDAKGNLVRNVGSFRPIYAAGYIQDKFEYKDLRFNIGLRVDYYNANQYALKDNYSVFNTVTAGDVVGLERPSNIGANFIPYVSDVNNPKASNVIGYRDPSKDVPTVWYNADGSVLQDPFDLAKKTSDGKIAPFLADPANSKKITKDLTSSSFTKYKAQINPMPRLSFAFPISDVAGFHAHYDVLVQRPGAGASTFNVFDVYNLENVSNGQIANANLKPERTIDYEIGFSQVLNESKSAGLELRAFYKENKDQVNTVSYTAAYPRTYTSFANVDFGTVKGLTSTFNLRRTGNVALTASYTLQFASGTGSSGTSAFNLVNLGVPTLRNPIPLDFDQRHNLVANIDYRFAGGKDYDGPTLGGKWGKKIFGDFGVNVTSYLSSGTPYTRQKNITTDVSIGVSQRSALDGSLNGSRKPWNYRFDMRVDKNIALRVGKPDAEGIAKEVNVNVYLQILNVLNNANITNVYRATGLASNDGYLNSSVGQPAIQTAFDPVSYRDLYTVKVNDPDNYGLPRLFRIGLAFDF